MYSNTDIDRNELKECLNKKSKLYRISVELESDISFQTPIKLTIENNTIEIFDKKSNISGYQRFIVKAVVNANWHNTAEDFITNLLYNFFSLNGGYISIIGHLKIEIYCKSNWIPHPSISGKMYLTKSIDSKLIEENIALTQALYMIILQKNDITQKTTKKINNIFELLKRATLLKNNSNYLGESFLSFYKILELIVEDMKSFASEVNPTEDILEMEHLGIISEIRSQKFKLYFLIKLFNIDFLEVNNQKILKKDLIKLADIRNKFAHSDVQINMQDLEIVNSLCLLSIKKYLTLKK